MTNETISNCKCAEDVVAYMYGELRAAEAASFESHLLSCTACTDEFAEISSVRYEVYEWKKLEFDHLRTPAIEIPRRYEPATVGFIEKARIAFGGWAVPSVAFAGLVIAVLVGGLFFGDNTGSDMAAVNSNEVARPGQVAHSEPLVEKRPDASSTPDIVDPEPAVEPPQFAYGSERVPRRTAQATKRSGPRVSEVKQTPVRNHTINAPSVRVQTASAPTLNEFIEEEDTSLRLAQLFDDIDTRD